MALRIIGIDHGSKESLVKECGAEAFLDVTKYDDKTITEEIKKLTGGKSRSLESSSCREPSILNYLRKGVQC
jgi:propanol-preferring alcohol dehydrogenase